MLPTLAHPSTSPRPLCGGNVPPGSPTVNSHSFPEAFPASSTRLELPSWHLPQELTVLYGSLVNLGLLQHISRATGVGTSNDSIKEKRVEQRWAHATTGPAPWARLRPGVDTGPHKAGAQEVITTSKPL